MRYAPSRLTLPWFATALVFAISIMALQAAPTSAAEAVAAPDSAVTTTGVPVVIPVLANDLDPEAGALTLIEVSDPANGSAVIDGDTVIYTSDPGFEGDDTFTYTVQDEELLTSIGSVTVTVTAPANNPPVAVDDSVTTSAGTPISIAVLTNDFDPDGHAISVSPGALARAAIKNLNPALQWECLPAGGSPVIVDQSGNGRDGIVTGVEAGSTTGDCDGGTAMTFWSWANASVTSTVPGLPSGSAPRSFLVRFKANFAGPGDVGLFGIGTNAVGNGQFSISRTGLGNDRLYLATWGNDAVIELPAGTNLGDGAEHTLVIVYDGATGVTAYVDGVAGPTANLFIPLATLDGQVTLGQTLYGAAGAGDEMRQFAVFATALEASEVAALHSSINAAAAYQSFTQPANGTVSLNGSELLYTPNIGFTGTDTFTYSISDSLGGVAGATVTVTVEPNINGNQAPIAVDDEAITVGETPVLIDVVANDSDPDGDPVSISPGALARAAIEGLGPVLHWECLPAGGSATLVDLSGNGRDGTVTGTTAGAATGDCDGGTAMSFFPGDSVTRTSPGLPSGASPRSILVRFKANVGGGDVGLFGYGTNAVGNGQFSVARTGLGNDKLYFAAWGNDAILELPAGTDLGDGQEHTLVFVYDGGTGLTAYVDGVAGTTANLFIPLATVDGVVHLGQTVYGASGFGDELRQFAVYAGALNAQQIADLHGAIDAAAAFQAFTQPANGTVQLTGNAVTYTANPGFTGIDTFSYSVSDGNGGIAAATVTVTVTAGLLAVEDGANTLTNDPVRIEVLGNDLGDGITIDSVTQPANGQVVIDGDAVVYTSAPNFIGTDTFTYTIINADLNTSTGTVTVLVAPDNIFPVALDDEASALFETPVTIEVLGNDSDEDGGTLFISPGALARAAILRQGPLLHWECLPFGGSSSQFDTSGNGRHGIVGNGVTPGTYTGDCDNGSSLLFNPGPTGVVSLANPNLPTGNQPRAALVRYKANQPLAADIPLFGYGLNGTPFAQFTVSRTVLGNDKLIFTSWANDLHFDLPPGFNIADGNEHTVMFVYDGNLTVYAYVDGIQSAPGILGTPLQTVDDTVMLGHSPWGWQGAGDEMRQFAIFPDAVSEPDAYLIHAAIEAAVLNRAYTQPQYGNITVSPDFQTMTYTPNPGYSGPDQFLYSVSDGQGGASVALVRLTVAGPIIAVDDIALVSGQTAIDVLANDTGTGVTITAVTDGAFGTVTTDGALVTYTPNPLYQGADFFTYTITDEVGQTRTATVEVNVTPDNTAPVAVDDEATTGQNEAVQVTVLTNDLDTDGDSLHVGSGSAARPTIVAMGPSLFWECLPAGGSTLFDYSGNGLTGTLSGGTFAGAATGDCDGGTAVGFTNGGKVTRSGVGSLPTGNDPRTVVFRFKAGFLPAGDIGLFGYGTNLTNFAQFSLARTGLGNDKLIFAGWNNDVVLDLPAGTNLGDGAEHTIAVVYDGARGLTAWVDGVAGPTATLWTDLDTGGDSIVLGQTLYGASGAGDELRQLMVFPVALGGTEINDIHSAINAAVPNVAFTQPSNGTVTLNNNVFTYTPALNFLGTDTFTYTVSDGRGGISTATVTVTVEAGIVTGDDEPETRAGMTVNVDVLGNDTAPIGGSLSIVSVTQPANGEAIIVSGQVVYVPAEGFSGTDTFTYTVEDGLGNVGTGTVTITVTPNGLPQGDDIEASTGTDQAIGIEILSTVTDPDGDDVSIDSVTQPANGSVSISGGQVLYTPDTAFQGVDTFTVTVVDTFGGTLELTVTVTVAGVPAELAVSPLTFLRGATVPANVAIVTVGQASENNGVPAGGTISVTFPAGTTFSGANDPIGWVITSTLSGTVGTSAVSVSGTTVTFTVDQPIPAGSGFSITKGFAGPAITFGEASGDVLVQAGIDSGTGTLTLVGLTLTPQWPTIVASELLTGQTETAITITMPTGGILGSPDSMDEITIVTSNGTLVAGPLAPGDLVATWLTSGPAASIEGALPGGEANWHGHVNVTLYASNTPGIATISIYRGSILLGSTTVEFLANGAPEGDDVEATTPAGTPVTIDVLGGVTDPEGDPFTVESVTEPANGEVVDFGDGTFGYIPNAGFAGTDTFTVTVVDLYGGTLAVTVTVQVNNNAPVGADVSTSTPQDTPVTIDILAGVTDPDGDDIEVTSVTQGANGSVAIVDGEVVYTPNAGFSGTDTFTVTVTDENGGTLVITVTVAVNGNPVGADVSTSTQQDTPVSIDILAGVTDPDGDDVELTSVTQGSNGSVAIVGGEVVYTPNPGFAGTDTFTVTVTDENGGTLVITVTVTVNGNPVGDDVEASTPAGTPVEIDILGGVTDPNGDEVEVSAVTQGANGTVTIDGGDVVYTPAPGFAGTDTFTVTVVDENGGTLVLTVTVEVTNGNPVGADVSTSTQQDTPVAIDILAGVTDPDGDDIELTSVTQGSNGSVAIVDGEVVYTPNPGFAGTDTFTVTVTDENGGTLVITVTVTVNGAPTADDAEASTQAGTPVAIDVLDGASDPNGDDLEVESVTQGANGSVTIDGGNVVYTPAPGFSGTDSFDVTIGDGNGGTVTITVAVTVNGSPVGSDASASTQQDTPVTIDILGGVTDPDGDAMEISAVTQGTNGSVTISGGNVVYTPNAGFSGTDTFTVTITDENGGSLTITVTVTVNGAPAGDDIETTTPAGTPVEIDVLGEVSDPDGDTLTIDGVSNPSNGTATVAGGSVTYTPASGFTGTDSFNVTVSDGNGGSATLAVTVTVQGAQRILIAQNACVALKVMPFAATYKNVFWLMGPDGPRSLGLNNQNVGQQVTVGYYVAGTELVFAIKVSQTGYTFVTGPASGNPDNLVHAEVTPGTGNVLYVVGFEDIYGGGDLDFNDAVFQLLSIPCAINAGNDTAASNGSAVTVDVLDNDTATAAPLTVTAVTQPANGTVTTDGETVTFTPNTGASGTATFTYTVTDAAGNTDTATVTVTIAAAFEAVDDAAVTPKNSAITMDVLANDSGTGLTLVSVTQPGPGNSKGTVSIVGGQVKYTPRNNFTGTVTFTYTVKNSANQTDTATVTVTVGAPTSGGTGTGRMTGGGYVTAGNGKATFGLSLRCNGSGNNFQFNDHSTGVKFHLTSITSVTCSDNPSINPKPRPASIDTMVLKGTGRLGGNGPTATVELTITDQGEPGRNDTITVTVRNASGTIISQVSGKLVGGNIQAHH